MERKKGWVEKEKWKIVGYCRRVKREGDVGKREEVRRYKINRKVYRLFFQQGAEEKQT